MGKALESLLPPVDVGESKGVVFGIFSNGASCVRGSRRGTCVGAGGLLAEEAVEEEGMPRAGKRLCGGFEALAVCGSRGATLQAGLEGKEVVGLWRPRGPRVDVAGSGVVREGRGVGSVALASRVRAAGGFLWLVRT